MNQTVLCAMPLFLAVYVPMCPAAIRPTVPQAETKIAELWQEPADLSQRDLFNGPWGVEHAPDPGDTYTFVRAKDHGTNPGVTVVDSQGREWHVKQPPPNKQGAEGGIEVVLSRVLSALGYHQPPVYFLPTFRMTDAAGAHDEPGGRFRLKVKELEHEGTWSWQRNPFVDATPYQGLLVILMMFDSSDLKNDNNALYEIKKPRDGVDRWYVVRDLGTALGETGRLHPLRGDPDIFEHHAFITGVKDGFVQFSYHGWHQELVRRRVTPSDVRWASELIGRLTDQQWAEAFRAGGYVPPVAARFIRRLQQKIADGRQVADWTPRKVVG